MSFNIQEPYYSLILEGKKTVEGRLNKQKFKDMKIGDVITIYKDDDIKQNFKVKITEKNEYKSFKDMLEVEGLQKVLPDVESIKAGVEIYYAFPGFKENEVNGVLAIRIQKI